MSELPDSYPPQPEEADDDWKSAAAEFIQARLELIRLEAREAGQAVALKVAIVVVIAGCAVLCWILVVAGLIGLVAAARDDWQWYHIALVAGGLHLIIALVALASLRKAGRAPFPLTRSEFAKDQSWLESMTRKPKR